MSKLLQGVLFGEDKYGAKDARIKCGLRNIGAVLEERQPHEHWSWVEDTAWRTRMIARVRAPDYKPRKSVRPRGLTPQQKAALADF